MTKKVLEDDIVDSDICLWESISMLPTIALRSLRRNLLSSIENDRRRGQQDRVIFGTAALWGFSEATLFFVVPDVLLSFVALRDVRLATRACLWALLGALVGGTVMYSWGSIDADSAERVLLRIPAIDDTMIGEVRQQIGQHGVVALFAGPLGGRPYKIYAVTAGATGISFVVFILVSIPARLIRFLAVTWTTALLANTVAARLKNGHKIVLWLACWLSFYAWYFSVH